MIAPLVLETAPEARAALNAALLQRRARHLAPPPRLTVSEWADRFRVLSREASAEPGPWRTDRVPYLRGILDALNEPGVERIVIQSSSQAGKSELLLNVCGYFMHQDPAPMLLVQPTIGEAEQFSKTRVAPMLRDTPALRDRVADPRSRDSGNTLLVKEYPGGHLTLVGANAPSGLAAKPIRVVLCDEVDRYPASAGSEGDPIQLATRRTATFWNRRVVLVSTPTVKGVSRIEAAYSEGDQRRFEVPCAACGAYQVLRWRQVQWPDGEPLRACYACAHCDARWTEADKLPALRAGRWVATAAGDGRTASFHVSALYSPFVRWSDLAAEWLTAHASPERLQVFVNTLLGETWEPVATTLKPETLLGRVEAYADADGVEVEVPHGVGVLTAGVDVQADRLEVIVRGWGAGEESWLIRRAVLLGDPAQPDVWQRLAELQQREWTHASGRRVRIQAMCVDSGFMTDQVYAWCRPRYLRGVFITKGSSQPGKPMIPRRPSTNNKARAKLFVIGTDAAKDILYARLRIAVPGPGYLHLNGDADEDYCAQLTAERLEKARSGGQWVRRYVLDRGRRNEVLDCEILAHCALLLGPIARERLGRKAAEWSDPPVVHPTNVPPNEPPAEPPDTFTAIDPPPRRPAPRPRPSGGFVTGWRR